MTVPSLFHRCLAPLFALAAIATVASAAPQSVECIARARELPPGATVTVRGTVTVPTGAFDSGFAVQQANAG